MKYSVRAVKRPGYAGRHRDGHFFSSDTPTVLDEVSDAICNDRHLIVEEVADAAPEEVTAVTAVPTDPETPAPRRKRQRK
jgi:hypothetical protein